MGTEKHQSVIAKAQSAWHLDGGAGSSSRNTSSSPSSGCQCTSHRLPLGSALFPLFFFFSLLRDSIQFFILQSNSARPWEREVWVSP